MDFDANTFDTQVVETNSFDFDGGLLSQLKQFKGGPTKVIVSSIVTNEILRHLREKTIVAKEAVESAHRKAQLYGLKSKNDLAFTESWDPAELAKQRLHKFFQRIGAEQIKYDDVVMRELVRMYFDASPPFAGSSKKKAEFPDAIALLSLEQWAMVNDAKILAVSGDKGWQDYKSDRITVVPDLADALAEMQVGADEAERLLIKLWHDMAASRRNDLREQLSRLLENAVSNQPATATWSSSFALEQESVSLAFIDFETDPESEVSKSVFIDSNELVVQVDLKLAVDAYGDFAVSVWDSIDREYLPFGSTSAEVKNVELEAEVLITLQGDFKDGYAAITAAITAAEIVRGDFAIDFEHIEPDFSGDSYDFEDEDGFSSEVSSDPVTG